MLKIHDLSIVLKWAPSTSNLDLSEAPLALSKLLIFTPFLSSNLLNLLRKLLLALPLKSPTIFFLKCFGADNLLSKPFWYYLSSFCSSINFTGKVFYELTKISTSLMLLYADFSLFSVFLDSGDFSDYFLFSSRLFTLPTDFMNFGSILA